ncbi:MAG: PLP-dependent aminotransferase family protein [Bryobacterales bacterium]|nr:PLP-dependent aminotransferase family protein [Bryobacterales bacterium]
MTDSILLDNASSVPIYRQLHRQLRGMIVGGTLIAGHRLPATRELAQDLGVNRATVSSAYALLEEEGLIHGHVGRGSFVSALNSETIDSKERTGRTSFESDSVGVTSYGRSALLSQASTEISFATSRPLAGLFPVEEFRESCQEVLGDEVAHTVLQLGSPLGYAPLRQYLMEEAELRGIGRSNDDILITNGCQQAIDLLARALLRPGDAVAVEEPVYPGLKAALLQAGARLVGVPVGKYGVDPEAFDRALERESPRFAVVTPSFQNPTGATVPEAARRSLLASARARGVMLVENDLYGELRYRGVAQPTVKSLDELGDTVLLGSFSKVAFPGLRVGWMIAPRPLIRKLAEIKQATDLHTDQLSQAVLLRFAESGRLGRHLERARRAGLAQLEAAVDGCRHYLPEGTSCTEPDGGLNLWVRLPAPLDADSLLSRAQMRGVSYLPARYFSVNRAEDRAFRLSFGGLTPDEIERGLRILGDVFREELERSTLAGVGEMATAMV